MIIMKVSEWLRTASASHVIQDAAKLAADYTKATGNSAEGWPTHTVAETRRRLAGDPRGGEVGGKAQQRVTYGYQLAVYLAEELVPGFRSTKSGRGFAFDEAVDALERAGL